MNYLYGDAWSMTGSTGGNDTLISGTGVEQMWGDAAIMLTTSVGGADTFVFHANNNLDTINDFQRAQGDKIYLSALATIDNFDVLDSNFTGTLGRRRRLCQCLVR